MTILKPQTFEPDGRAIPFIEEGEGHLVVLLPGRGLDIASLGTLAHVLEEEGFRVLRVGSRRPSVEAPVTMHDLAQDVVDVLDHLDIATAWIVGHAFGGAVARTIALDHAGRTEGLVLLGVVGPEPLSDEAARAVEIAFSDAADSDAHEAMRVFVGEGVDPAAAWNLFSRLRNAEIAQMQSAALAATPAEEWSPLPERLPISIVQGAEDRVTPPVNGEQLRATAPERAALASIPAAGHLFVLTHPAEIGAEIEDYLGWD